MEARLQYEITRLAHRRRSRSFSEIIAGYEEALRVAREVGDRRTEGLALTEIATAHWDEGRLDEAARVGLQALEILKETGDHAATAGVMNLLSMTCYMAQDIPGGLQWGEQALREARLAGDRAREATALSYLGLITGVDGRNDEGLRLLDEAAAVAEEIGDRRRIMWVHFFRSFGYWSLARFDLMVHAVDAGLELGERIGYINPGNIGLAVLAHLLIGDLPQAHKYARQAIAALLPNDPETPTVLGIAALLKVVSSSRQDAAVALEEAERSMLKAPRSDYLLIGGAWVAMGWVEIGEPDRAEALAEQVLGLMAGGRLLEIRCVCHVALGRAAVLQRRFPQAAEAFDRADAHLSDTQNPQMRLEIALGRHYLAAAADRPDEADDHLRAAERWADEIRDRMDDPALREQFKGSWIVSRVTAARTAFGPTRGSPARSSEG
jgi:tetratricopeptide (TPR) repeat protein